MFLSPTFLSRDISHKSNSSIKDRSPTQSSVKESSSQQIFFDSTISNKLYRAKAKLKLINIEQKKKYEVKLNKMSMQERFNLDDIEESKVSLLRE